MSERVAASVDGVSDDAFISHARKPGLASWFEQRSMVDGIEVQLCLWASAFQYSSPDHFEARSGIFTIEGWA